MLYRALWRLTLGTPHLLQITTDDDVYSLTQMQKTVTRDVHKMKAFVRFRNVIDAVGDDNYVAWHRPDHRIVRLVAPFFARRFKGMNWSILTPDESVNWDQHRLTFRPGIPAREAPDGEALEELWKTYYASIFNPARVKVAAMKREMPVRHWPTLPEAALTDDLLRQAPQRVESMVQQSEGFAETAMHYMPVNGDALDRTSLESLREAAACCKACHLYQYATQTVFGEGPSDAKIVLVGEQPGDREDIQGHPFVGPAGKLLNEALGLAEIDRSQVYVTNVVKHFKFSETSTPRGKQRLHKKPDSREIFACRPWLEAELAVIQPEVVVCLGATTAQALFGRDFRITGDRGVMRDRLVLAHDGDLASSSDLAHAGSVAATADARTACPRPREIRESTEILTPNYMLGDFRGTPIRLWLNFFKQRNLGSTAQRAAFTSIHANRLIAPWLLTLTQITLAGAVDTILVTERRTITSHRMNIGTIVADASMQVKFQKGKTLGTAEESFLSKLKAGDRLLFAGRLVSMLRIRDNVAYVKLAKGKPDTVPRWMGG